ncbi:hypothetical protein ACNKHP_14285 [Shigella boydii]
MRQLENTCRWLTVMAAGQEVLIQDLPGELSESTVERVFAMQPDSWATLLAQWADRALVPVIKILLFRKRGQEAGADVTDDRVATAQGHKQEAAGYSAGPQRPDA